MNSSLKFFPHLIRSNRCLSIGTTKSLVSFCWTGEEKKKKKKSKKSRVGLHISANKFQLHRNTPMCNLKRIFQANRCNVLFAHTSFYCRRGDVECSLIFCSFQQLFVGWLPTSARFAQSGTLQAVPRHRYLPEDIFSHLQRVSFFIFTNPWLVGCQPSGWFVGSLRANQWSVCPQQNAQLFTNRIYLS